MFRAIAFLAVALLLCDVAGRIYLIGHVRPQVEKLRATNAELDALHAGMIDQETGSRAFLSTGSTLFLPPYQHAVPVIQASSSELAADVLPGQMTRDFVDLQVARQRWNEDWVRLALDPASAAIIGSGAAARSRSCALETSMRGCR